MPDEPQESQGEIENTATPAEEAVAPAVDTAQPAAPSAPAEPTDATPGAPEANPESTAEAQVAQAAQAAAFLAELRARLAQSNYGLSASLELAFTPGGLLLLEADDAQEALRAASAAIADADDGREWRFVGNGPDLDTGRSRAVVRITPLPY